MKPVIITDSDVWDKTVCSMAGHPLQLWGWGELKRRHNWDVERVLIENEAGKVIGCAQLLFRKLPGALKITADSVAYCPRGPVCHSADRQRVSDELAQFVKRNHRCLVITVEPDWEDNDSSASLSTTSQPVSTLNKSLSKKWRKTPNTILIDRTLILDLTLSEGHLHANMAKKTRQYIRKSNLEDIVIRPVISDQDFSQCMNIYRETARRARFTLHINSYYEDARKFLDDNGIILAAFVNDAPAAFLWVTVSDVTAFELYGGMNKIGQKLRLNYALKWKMICLMKERGVRRYDFNGLLNDSISTFKKGFSTHENRLIGSYDYPMSQYYYVWRYGLPTAKKVYKRIINNIRR